MLKKQKIYKDQTIYNKMMKRVLLIFILILGVVSASVTCSISSIDKTYVQGQTPPIIPSFSCSNNDLNNSVQVNKVGSFFSVDPSTPFTISDGGTKGTITITLNQMSVGIYEGMLYSTGLELPIHLTVTEPEQIQGCRLIELPHTTTYRVKQGESGLSNQIRVKVSKDCESSMTGVTVTEQTQMTKPMYLQGSSGDVEPGEEFSFSIGLDAEGVTKGTYQNTYIVSGSVGDEVYQKSITLFTVVTVGTSPSDSGNFTNLPRCTLDADMSLNNTYKLTCNNDNPNIDIEVPYNNYFEGVDVSESEGKFEYILKPTKVGNTNLVALFKYKGVSIGTPFSKDIRIMQGNVPLQGTDLKILFYQLGIKKEMNGLSVGETNILVKDNNTDSIVPSFTAYLNGNLINSSFNLEPSKNYEMIISSSGYLSKTINFNISHQIIDITLIPNQNTFYVGDSLNANCLVNGTYYLYDNSVITLPYKLPSNGNHTLKAIKEGYTSWEKNITVLSSISYISTSPLLDEWKKGKTITVELNEIAEWKVYFSEETDSDPLTYATEKLLESGNSKTVQFKAEGYGKYDIRSGDKTVLSKTLEKKGWRDYYDWTKEHWVWSLIIGVVVIIIITTFFKKDTSSEPFAFNPQMGGS